MAFAQGTRLGPYEIIAPIGAGGMGEVYRAHDTRLGRDVAIKVLPATYSSDPDRLSRFKQEASAASMLNHPNILSIYDVGTQEGSPYVVSELLEGETLRRRLRGAGLPQRKVVDYALQIAHGLAAAHDKGIVHRDLKPENVFVTNDGRVKILDFGLAKLVATAEDELPQTDVPTQKVLTEPGMVMGSTGYMSPEQVRGVPADHRSDIFAFGAMLYEMISGKRAFLGASKADTMSAILKEDPPEMPEASRNIAPGLERIVHHCLEKNPSERFHSASDLAFAIEALSGSSGSQNIAIAASPHLTKKRELMAWGVVPVAFLIAAAAIWFWYSRGTQTGEPSAMRFFVYPPEKTTFQGGAEFVSPDGRRLIFSAVGADGKRFLWIRSLNSLEAQMLAGTEDASQAFWSPDSRFIAFFAGGKLKKIEASGGLVQTLADAQGSRGGTWSRNGVIVFAPSFGDVLYRVSATGGPATPVTALDAARGQTGHAWPYFLPDGKHFLYLARSSQRQNSGIYAGSIDSKDSKFLISSDASAAYSEPGYLLFLRERTLMGQPFDAGKLQLSGESFPVIERMGYSATTGRALFSVSDNGVLAYRLNVPLNSQLVWYDRTGKQLEKIGNEGDFLGFSLSPDEQRLAIARLDPEAGSYDLWLIDLARGASSRFTFEQTNETFPVWSPDGSHVDFASNRNGPADLFQKSASGAGNDELIVKSNNLKAPTSWSADGRTILFAEFDPKTTTHLWRFQFGGDGKAVQVLQTNFEETAGQFSPDGKLIAYQSNESGAAQVYVQTFPASSRKWQVSTSGGFQPKWRADGKELFYIAPDKKLMAVDVNSDPNDFKPGVPRALFEVRIGNLPGNPYYDVTRDGKRFLASVAVESRAPQPITVVLNWNADAKR